MEAQSLPKTNIRDLIGVDSSSEEEEVSPLRHRALFNRDGEPALEAADCVEEYGDDDDDVVDSLVSSLELEGIVWLGVGTPSRLRGLQGRLVKK